MNVGWPKMKRDFVACKANDSPIPISSVFSCFYLDSVSEKLFRAGSKQLLRPRCFEKRNRAKERERERRREVIF